MTLPSSERLHEIARKRVLEADAKDTLHTLTPKLLRREIEKELGLSEGELDTTEYKNAIKTAIEATVVGRILPSKTKPKSSVKSATKAEKRMSDAGTTEAPKKKPRVKKEQGEKKTRKGVVSAKKASPPPIKAKSESADSSPEDKPTSTRPPAKRRKIASARIEDSGDEEEYGEAVRTEPPASATDVGSGDTTMVDSQANLPQLPMEDTDAKARALQVHLLPSLSFFEKTSSKTLNRKNGGKRKTKESENMSKDDATIKKLKSLVVACGVRKVWSKEFQGLDAPSQQIKKLKEILRELGMTGRMSVEQAKSIRTKREFAQELQDVQEFEKAVLKRGSASKNDDNGDSGDEEEEDDDPKPRRRKMTAAQSITAFLGDQSSDDD
ncbi:hypothetical protein AN958_00267 [Leucoagaricus sp. SymC.cos]|nr:hypothetical protein AN958_03981 [Leucoagaricus sp. SymC.cos]KXN93343.1 hypothetical protein AN958_00267 [Leucoagaricus sp. SymC.cos]